jgi:hypothetical protein
MSWKDKKVTELEILSLAGRTCTLDIEGEIKVIEGGKEVATRINEKGYIQFPTEGRTFQSPSHP